MQEEQRPPSHTVSHYVTYLRRYVTATMQRAHTASQEVEARDVRAEPLSDERPSDSITPMSYFIRKLKLDLKMSYLR